jgi:hypothetical protein
LAELGIRDERRRCDDNARPIGAGAEKTNDDNREGGSHGTTLLFRSGTGD